MEEKMHEENESSHINNLASEIVGQVLGELSVVDRLQCEGVNRRWKKIVWDMGWTQQTKLSYDIVFKGATGSQKKKFKNESLKRLFRRFGANLTELNLEYFPIPTIYSLQNDTNIFRWLCLLPKLSELDISGINFRKAAYFLPRSLIELHSSGPFDEQNLEALADKCPDLEIIHFDNKKSPTKLPIGALNALFGQCQNLKTIHLVDFDLLMNFIDNEANVSLTALGQLEWLEELSLDSVEAFDDVALRALIAGCPQLKKLKIVQIAVSEEAIRELDQHPNLVDFETKTHPELDEDIEMEINGRWKIKKYKHLRSQISTDESGFLKLLNEIASHFSSQSFIDELIQLGLLPLLIKSLSSTNSELQFEAVRALVAISGGTDDQTGAVVEVGAVPELLKLLGSKRGNVREQSLQALTNINSNVDFRDLCVELGFIERLLAMVEVEESMEILLCIDSICGKICQTPLPPTDIVKTILPVLGKLIVHNKDAHNNVAHYKDTGAAPWWYNAAAAPWGYNKDVGAILFSSIWTLSNIAGEKTNLVIPPLCELLRTRINTGLLLDILVTLNNILEKSGTRTEEVCKKIKRCRGSRQIWRNYESEDLKKVADEIIEKFFPPSEEDQNL